LANSNNINNQQLNLSETSPPRSSTQSQNNRLSIHNHQQTNNMLTLFQNSVTSVASDSNLNHLNIPLTLTTAASLTQSAANTTINSNNHLIKTENNTTNNINNNSILIQNFNGSLSHHIYL
jgi:hypothetical protein